MSESSTVNRPIICVVLKPKNDDDRPSLERALNELAQQDPTCRVEMQSPDGKITVSGMSELQLEMIFDRIIGEHKIQIEMEKPEIIYLETIRKKAEAEGKYVRAISGRGMYGHVQLRLEPLEAGYEYQFINESSEACVPQKFLEAISSGIQQAMKSGVLAGGRMVNVRAALCGGSYHEGNSNEFAFKIAASMAFIEAARKANPVILEPLMSIEVATSHDFAGMVTGDLSFRRGRIEGMKTDAKSLVVSAMVPLAELIGYATHLRASTQGRASYAMKFARYEQVPQDGDSGAGEAGVVLTKPREPIAGRGKAVAKRDSEIE